MNDKTRSEMTPLMIAAGHGNLEVVKILVSKGADINDTSSWGETALYYA